MKPTTYAEQKRDVRTFALASFLNDLGSDMVFSVWPLFVTTVLGANMSVLGFIDGLGDSLVSISQAISGYVSDRIRKRKIFVWLGYGFGFLSRIGYAFSTVWQMLIPFRILDRTGKMRGAPRDAIVADVSAKENRGKNFGIIRAMDNFGAVCGVIVSIAFLGFLGYRNLFLLASIPSAIAMILVFSMVRERKAEGIKIYKGLQLRDLSGNFKLYLLLSSFFALGSFSYSFLLVYANVSGFQAVYVPVLYLLFTVFAAIFSLPFGKLSDKIGRKSVLGLGYVFWAGVCAVLILFQSYLSVILAFVLFGLHRAAIDPVQKAFVSELAPAQYRASSLGGFQFVTGMLALPASLFAGILWDTAGMLAPFYFSLALTILSLVIFAFVKETRW